MYSDGDKLRMKIVAFVEIYNFVVRTFSFEVVLRQKNDTLPRSQFSVSESGYYIDYLSHKMTSNKKKLNYKVTDLVESYNFHIKCVFIWVHTEKLWCFENELTHTRVMQWLEVL
jgi:hypothetical protein